MHEIGIKMVIEKIEVIQIWFTAPCLDWKIPQFYNEKFLIHILFEN